jgi:uncharacterized protein
VTWVPPPLNPSLPETLPVFPLPGVVFFPGTVLPLHIFEARYRKMVRDAREGDGLIALALLKPGWEREYYESPEVHRLGCAGRIIEAHELPDGRFNIKLAGVCRALFLGFDSERPYRVARVRPVRERVPLDLDPGVAQAKAALVCAYAQLVAAQSGDPATGLEDTVTVPIHPLVNTVCTHIDLPPGAKQRLLRLDDVLERCTTVTQLLHEERDRILRAAPRRTGGSRPPEGGETIH